MLQWSHNPLERALWWSHPDCGGSGSGKNSFTGKVAVVDFVRCGGPVKNSGGSVESGSGRNSLILTLFLIFFYFVIFWILNEKTLKINTKIDL